MEKSTNLMEAARSNDVAGAQRLMALGVDVNAQDKNGLTPLHAAANHRSYEVAELLISQGANVNAQDKNGLTPLHVAANFSAHVAHLLMQHGADVMLSNHRGEFPADYARNVQFPALAEAIKTNAHWEVAEAEQLNRNKLRGAPR